MPKAVVHDDPQAAADELISMLLLKESRLLEKLLDVDSKHDGSQLMYTRLNASRRKLDCVCRKDAKCLDMHSSNNQGFCIPCAVFECRSTSPKTVNRCFKQFACPRICSKALHSFMHAVPEVKILCVLLCGGAPCDHTVPCDLPSDLSVE